FGARLAGGPLQLAVALGYGGRIDVSDTFYLNVDALATLLHHPGAFDQTHSLEPELRALVGVRLTKEIAVFGGPAYRLILAPDEAHASISPYGSSLLHREPSLVVRGWPGITLGVEFEAL